MLFCDLDTAQHHLRESVATILQATYDLATKQALGSESFSSKDQEGFKLWQEKSLEGLNNTLSLTSAPMFGSQPKETKNCIPLEYFGFHAQDPQEQVMYYFAKTLRRKALTEYTEMSKASHPQSRNIEQSHAIAKQVDERLNFVVQALQIEVVSKTASTIREALLLNIIALFFPFAEAEAQEFARVIKF